MSAEWILMIITFQLGIIGIQLAIIANLIGRRER
jgi:hypothetical protein